MDKQDIEKIVDERIKGNFTARRIGDTPTDAYQLVNRKYVELHGTTAERPNSSVATVGQQYFSTSLGKPIFFNGTNWVDSTSSVVAG